MIIFTFDKYGALIKWSTISASEWNLIVYFSLNTWEFQSTLVGMVLQVEITIYILRDLEANTLSLCQLYQK